MEFDFQRGSLKRVWLFWNSEDGRVGGGGPVRAENAWRAAAASCQLSAGSLVSLYHLRMSVDAIAFSTSHRGTADGRTTMEEPTNMARQSVRGPICCVFGLAGQPTHLCDTEICVNAAHPSQDAGGWLGLGQMGRVAKPNKN